MKIVKKIIMASIVCTLCFGSCQIAGADAGSYLNINQIIVNSDGTVQLGTSPQPSNTCSYYSIFFSFNSNSLSGGKQMLSTLLTAKAAGKTITVWYNNATYPGSNETNGCTPSNLATVTGVAIN